MDKKKEWTGEKGGSRIGKDRSEVMALLRNNTVLLRHESYGGAQPWSSSSSFFCVVGVSGLWPNPFPMAIKCSTSTQALRSNRCRLFPNPSFYGKQTPKANAEKHEQRQQEEDEEYKVVTSIRSNYNDILILDTAKARMLLLDSSCNCRFSFVFSLLLLRFFLIWGVVLLFNFNVIVLYFVVADNVHSILYKHQKWTDSYWV